MAVLVLLVVFSHYGGAAIPSGCFDLTVQDIVADSDVRVVVLTVKALRAGSISVDSDSSHTLTALPQGSGDGVREGSVVITASRVALAGDKEARIQLLVRTVAAGGHAGGPTVYTAPVDTELDTFLTVCATDGVYRLDAPVTIAQVQGKPVTLTVGTRLTCAG
jgi:hypothetical protein